MSNILAEATTRGVLWTSVSEVLRQGFQFIVIAILARLLFPEDLGVIAVAAFFLALIGRVRLGFRFPVIQREEISQSHLSTLFWTGVVVGVILWGICVVASPLAASFVRIDLIRPILVVLSIEFIISSFGLVQGGLLSRNMEFRKLAIVEIGGTVATGLFSVWLAYSDFGVWSLVWGDLLGSSIMVLLLWKLCPWHPRLHFSFDSLRDLSGFGAAVVSNSLVNFVGTDADKLLVGRLLGPGILGIYSQASRLSQFPRLHLSSVVAQVTFPAFSRIQNEDARLRYGHLKSVTYISMAAFPLLAGLAVVASEFVGVAYGAKWVDMILPLQILCFAGASSSVGTLSGSVAFSKGRADLLLKMNLIKFPIIIGILVLSIPQGMVVLAITISLFFTGWVLVHQVVINRLIQLRMVDWLYSLYPAVLGTAGMVAFLLPFRWLAVTFLTLPDAVLLISFVLVGTVTYLLTLRIARTKELSEIYELLSSASRQMWR